MRTTATETLAVAGNIFVGMVSTKRPPGSCCFSPPPGGLRICQKTVQKSMFSFWKLNKWKLLVNQHLRKSSDSMGTWFIAFIPILYTLSYWFNLYGKVGKCLGLNLTTFQGLRKHVQSIFWFLTVTVNHDFKGLQGGHTLPYSGLTGRLFPIIFAWNICF